MSITRDLLKDLTTEAAIADLPMEGPIEGLDEAMLDAGDAATLPTVAETVGQATQAADLGAQFQDLEQRADALEEKAANATSEIEQQIVQVSAECLVREFDTLITAYGMGKAWHSYSIEAAQSPIEQIKAVKGDAKKYGDITRKAAKDLGDVSNEAAGLTKISMRHKPQLSNARAALQNATRRVEANTAELRDHPRMINNNGQRRFLTREGKEVHDLPAAIHAEAAWMAKAHAASQAANSAIIAAVQKAKHDPNISVESLGLDGALRAVRELTTTKGYLMGNHTVEIKESAALVPRYVRKNDFESGTASKIGTGVMGAVGAYVGAHLVSTVGLVIGGVGLGPVALGAAAMGAAAAYGNRQQYTNQSKVTSIASANDIKKVLHEVLGYDKYTDSGYDSKLATEIDDMHASGANGAVLNALHTAVWNLFVLNEIVYDQALYTTLRMAALAKDLA